MSRQRLKVLATLLSFSVATMAYPHIRHSGRWSNSDFIHQIPKVAAAIDAGSVFPPIVSGNSLLYPAEVIVLERATGMSPPGLLLFATPFTVGTVLLLTMYLVFRRFTAPRWALTGIAILITIPLILDLRAGGKHSIFTFTLFFTGVLAISAREYRHRLLLSLISFSLILYHIYISAIFIGFVALYTTLAGMGNEGSQISPHGNLTAVIFAGGVSWMIYILNTPALQFSRFLFGILPPYSTTASISPYEGGAKAGSGIRQFFDILTQRWEPWWIWLVLILPLAIMLILTFATWLRSIVAIARRKRSIDVPLAMSTVGGIFGIGVVGVSLGGFSATNLIFRYLTYFVPWGVLLIVSRILRWSGRSRKIAAIGIAAILIMGMIAAPVKTSREPKFQSQRLGIYTEYEAAALGWFIGHSNQNITVSNTINMDVIYYSEFRDYRPRSEMPTTRQSAPFSLISPRTIEDTTKEHVYDNQQEVISANATA